MGGESRCLVLALFPALLFVVRLPAPPGAAPDRCRAERPRSCGARDVLSRPDTTGQIALDRPRSFGTQPAGALWSSSSAMTAIIDTLTTRLPRQGASARGGASASSAVFLTVVLAGHTGIGWGSCWPADARHHWEQPARAARSPRWRSRSGRLSSDDVDGLGCVYRFAPDVRRRRAWVTPGSIAATLLWMIASLGFDWYADHVGEYQKTYGAIGGVIVLLLWLYASGLAILVGAELNAPSRMRLPRDRPRQHDGGRASAAAGVRRVRR